jgi:hypothetical protein
LTRTRPTQIFQAFKSEDLNKIELWYDPKANSIALNTRNSSQKQSFRLKDTIDILFVMFNDNKQLNIYTDCPSLNRKSLIINLDTNVDYLEVGQNSKNFSSLNDAMEAYKCKSILSVLPGTLIRFAIKESNSSTSIGLFNFLFEKETLSVNLLNRNIIITKSGLEFKTIFLRDPIHSNEIFLVFSNEGLAFYVGCPYQQEHTAFWSASYFESKLTIEVSLPYEIANAGSSILLNSFCKTNFRDGTVDVEAVSRERKYYSRFLPTKKVIEEIEMFDHFANVDFGNLIENEARILIASRNNSHPEFFYKGIQDYINGFSDGQQNLWIGLDSLNKLTTRFDFKLRIVVRPQTDSKKTFLEEYSFVRVGNKSEGFMLSVGDLVFGGNVGYFGKNNGTNFSTFDFGDRLMAFTHSSGYWHKADQPFCFTCIAKSYDNEKTSVDVLLGETLESIETSYIKMFLIVSKTFKLVI